MSTANLSSDVVAQKIRDARGNIAAVAASLRLSRQQVYRFIERHPSLKVELAESRETMKDMAESVLYAKVVEGEAWAVCFFLKTQAKERGYVERSEVTGKDGGPVTIKVIYDAKDA